jgi:hypothetical protein
MSFRISNNTDRFTSFGNSVETKSLKVSDPLLKTQSSFETQQGKIYIGSSTNSKFGTDKNSFILQTGNDITSGLSVGTLKKGQPLILGASNTRVLTMKVDSGIGINTPKSIILNPVFLPTEDPEVVGQLWNNSNVLTISAGGISLDL